MKAQLSDAGLSDIPVSISDMAYGWQNAGGDITPMVDVVDFFMINNFPFFSEDATTGGSAGSWNDFVRDVEYFQSIAEGKPLMVTQVRAVHLRFDLCSLPVIFASYLPNVQTGWSTSREEFARTVIALQAGYWNLLDIDRHCADYFKTNGIAWRTTTLSAGVSLNERQPSVQYSSQPYSLCEHMYADTCTVERIPCYTYYTYCPKSGASPPLRLVSASALALDQPADRGAHNTFSFSFVDAVAAAMTNLGVGDGGGQASLPSSESSKVGLELDIVDERVTEPFRRDVGRRRPSSTCRHFLFQSDTVPFQKKIGLPR